MNFGKRIERMEAAARMRWGELSEIDSDDDQADTSPPTDLLALSVIVDGVQNDMSKLTEAMDRLTADITALTSTVDGVLAQNNTVIALLRENAGDPDAINKIADTVEAYNARIASAIVSNTPATQPGNTEAAPIADPIAEPASPAETAAAANTDGVTVPPTP